MSTEKISISRFMARRHAFFEEARRTGKPVLVTRYGEPVAEILPTTPVSSSDDWLGCMSGKGKILDDIVVPASDLPEWGVLRD